VHRGPGRGRGPWVHRGPGHLNRRGTRSPSSTRDPTALDESMRRAAAMSPGTGAARRRAAALRRRKLWGELPAVFSCTSGCYTLLRGWRTHLGVQGRGSSSHGGRRRKGAEPLLRRARAVGAVLKREGKRRGQFCSPRRGNGSEHKVDEEALKGEFDVDGELRRRSGGWRHGAAWPRGDEVPLEQGERERDKPRVHRRRRVGDGVLHRRRLLRRRRKQRRRRCGVGLGYVYWRAGVAKGKGGSVCASLNRSREREGRGKEAAAEPSAMGAPAAGFQVNWAKLKETDGK
jgi:hypothetical protein